MRRLCVTVALATSLLAASCTGSDAASPSPSPHSGAATSSTPSSPASASASVSPATTLPPGVPTSYDQDVGASQIPARALVPEGTEVTGVWLASTSGGEAVVVAYTKRGRDPFVQAPGFVVWRRSEGSAPPWLPVLGIGHSKSEGILGIQGITGDATGDGSDDIVLFEATGGVGNCGTWRVIDPGAGLQRWHRSLCDAQVGISADPPGLTLTETVYEPGDPHCCPSAIRTSVLGYDPPDRFVRVSEEVTPL